MPKYWGKQIFKHGRFPEVGQKQNTPGTAGGPGGRDRTLAVKRRKNVRKITFFSLKKKFTQFFVLHISSSYAKILGEKLFRTWEIPRSWSKAKNGERKRERERERLNDGDNNGQATHGARKPPGPKYVWWVIF